MNKAIETTVWGRVVAWAVGLASAATIAIVFLVSGPASAQVPGGGGSGYAVAWIDGVPLCDEDAGTLC